MKSAVENLGPTRVKLTVEVPFEELKPDLDNAYKAISQQVQVPGFRKGKVPPRIIDQRVGRAAVLQEAVNEALPRLYGQALQESDVRPLGQPEVEVSEVPDPQKGGDLKFTAELDVRPEIQLPDYSTLEVVVDDVEVSDADVDERLESLRERFGTLVGVERAAQDGDFTSIDLAAEIDGDEIDSVKGISYQIGSGTMLAGLDEALVGASAGETKTFASPLAGGDRAGEEAQVTVTLQAVKERQLPEADDEFAQLASEFDTLEELRADLREQAMRAKRFEQGVQARDKVLEALLEAVDVPVPDGLIQAEVERHLEAEDRSEDDEHRAEVEVEARKAFAAQLVLDEVAQKEQVQVQQPELVEYIVANAQRMGMDPNAFAQAVDAQGQVPAMVGEVARRKALAVVLEAATVKSASGEVLDLDELVGQRGETVDVADDESDDVVTEGDELADGGASEGADVTSDVAADAPADPSDPARV